MTDTTDGLLDLMQMAIKTKKSLLSVRRAVWSGALPALRVGKKIYATREAFATWRKAKCPTSLPATVEPYRMVPKGSRYTLDPVAPAGGVA